MNEIVFCMREVDRGGSDGQGGGYGFKSKILPLVAVFMPGRFDFAVPQRSGYRFQCLNGESSDSGIREECSNGCETVYSNVLFLFPRLPRASRRRSRTSRFG
jgi:hypothetical protein